MATSLGELILELKLDPSAYNRQLNEAKASASKVAATIEAQFAKALGKSVSPNLKAENLTALGDSIDDIGDRYSAIGNRQSPFTTLDDGTLFANRIIANFDRIDARWTSLNTRINSVNQAFPQGFAEQEQSPQAREREVRQRPQNIQDLPGIQDTLDRQSGFDLVLNIDYTQLTSLRAELGLLNADLANTQVQLGQGLKLGPTQTAPDPNKSNQATNQGFSSSPQPQDSSSPESSSPSRNQTPQYSSRPPTPSTEPKFYTKQENLDRYFPVSKPSEKNEIAKAIAGTLEKAVKESFTSGFSQLTQGQESIASKDRKSQESKDKKPGGLLGLRTIGNVVGSGVANMARGAAQTLGTEAIGKAGKMLEDDLTELAEIYAPIVQKVMPDIGFRKELMAKARRSAANAEIILDSDELADRKQKIVSRVKSFKRSAFEDGELGQSLEDGVNVAQSTAKLVNVPRQVLERRYQDNIQENSKNLGFKTWNTPQPGKDLGEGDRIVFTASRDNKQLQETLGKAGKKEGMLYDFVPFEVARNEKLDAEQRVSLGYNPAANRMASEVRNYQEANPKRSIDIVAEGDFASIATDAKEILKNLGIAVQVITVNAGKDSPIIKNEDNIISSDNFNKDNLAQDSAVYTLNSNAVRKGTKDSQKGGRVQIEDLNIDPKTPKALLDFELRGMTQDSLQSFGKATGVKNLSNKSSAAMARLISSQTKNNLASSMQEFRYLNLAESKALEFSDSFANDYSAIGSLTGDDREKAAQKLLEASRKQVNFIDAISDRILNPAFRQKLFQLKEDALDSQQVSSDILGVKTEVPQPPKFEDDENFSIEDFKKKAEKTVKLAGKLASNPLDIVRVRREAEFDRSYQEALRRSHDIEAPKLGKDVESINFSFGGMGGHGGESTDGVSRGFGLLGGANNPFVAVDGIGLDTSTHKTMHSPQKYSLDAYKKLFELNVSKGRSDDAIEAVAHYLAYKRENPEVKGNFVGFSYGGAAAQEASEILSSQGQDVRGLGVATPSMASGHSRTEEHSKNYSVLMGEHDIWNDGKNEDITEVVPGVGKGHEFKQYVGKREFNKAFYSKLGITKKGKAKGSEDPRPMDQRESELEDFLYGLTESEMKQFMFFSEVKETEDGHEGNVNKILDATPFEQRVGLRKFKNASKNSSLTRPKSLQDDEAKLIENLEKTKLNLNALIDHGDESSSSSEKLENMRQMSHVFGSFADQLNEVKVRGKTSSDEFIDKISKYDEIVKDYTALFTGVQDYLPLDREGKFNEALPQMGMDAALKSPDLIKGHLIEGLISGLPTVKPTIDAATEAARQSKRSGNLDVLGVIDPLLSKDVKEGLDLENSDDHELALPIIKASLVKVRGERKAKEQEDSAKKDADYINKLRKREAKNLEIFDHGPLNEELTFGNVPGQGIPPRGPRAVLSGQERSEAALRVDLPQPSPIAENLDVGRNLVDRARKNYRRKDLLLVAKDMGVTGVTKNSADGIAKKLAAKSEDELRNFLSDLDIFRNVEALKRSLVSEAKRLEAFNPSENQLADFKVLQDQYLASFEQAKNAVPTGEIGKAIKTDGALPRYHGLKHLASGDIPTDANTAKLNPTDRANIDLADQYAAPRSDEFGANPGIQGQPPQAPKYPGGAGLVAERQEQYVALPIPGLFNAALPQPQRMQAEVALEDYDLPNELQHPLAPLAPKNPRMGEMNPWDEGLLMPVPKSKPKLKDKKQKLFAASEFDLHDYPAITELPRPIAPPPSKLPQMGEMNPWDEGLSMPAQALPVIPAPPKIQKLLTANSIQTLLRQAEDNAQAQIDWMLAQVMYVLSLGEAMHPARAALMKRGNQATFKELSVISREMETPGRASFNKAGIVNKMINQDADRFTKSLDALDEWKLEQAGLKFSDSFKAYDLPQPIAPPKPRRTQPYGPAAQMDPWDITTFDVAARPVAPPKLKPQNLLAPAIVLPTAKTVESYGELVDRSRKEYRKKDLLLAAKSMDLKGVSKNSADTIAKKLADKNQEELKGILEQLDVMRSIESLKKQLNAQIGEPKTEANASNLAKIQQQYEQALAQAHQSVKAAPIRDAIGLKAPSIDDLEGIGLARVGKPVKNRAGLRTRLEAGVRPFTQKFADNHKANAQGLFGPYEKSKEAEDVEQRPERILFASGGFSGKEGQGVHLFLDELQEVSGKKTKVVPFENKKFDVNASVDADGFVAWAKDAIKQTLIVAFKGQNPAAVELAQKVAAFKQENPETPVDLLGHSAGGFIVKEAQLILAEMGIQVRTLSLGTPNMGAYKGTQKDALSLMGSGDPLRTASDSTTRGTGAKGHDALQYLADTQTAKVIKDFAAGQESLNDIEKKHRLESIRVIPGPLDILRGRHVSNRPQHLMSRKNEVLKPLGKPRAEEVLAGPLDFKSFLTSQPRQSVKLPAIPRELHRQDEVTQALIDRLDNISFARVGPDAPQEEGSTHFLSRAMRAVGLGKYDLDTSRAKNQKEYQKMAAEIIAEQKTSKFKPRKAMKGVVRSQAPEGLLGDDGKLLPRLTETLSDTEKATQMTFFAGGFARKKGMESEYIGREISETLPDHHVVPVETPDFDHSNPGGKLSLPELLKRTVALITTGSKETGRNEASKRMAARAYAYHKENPDLPVNVMGQSGGSMVARGAANILDLLGVPDVRVVSSAGPSLGASKNQGITLTSDKDSLVKMLAPLMTNRVQTNTVGDHISYFNKSQEGSFDSAEKTANNETVVVNEQVQEVLKAYFDRDRSLKNADRDAKSITEKHNRKEKANFKSGDDIRAFVASTRKEAEGKVPDGVFDLADELVEFAHPKEVQGGTGKESPEKLVSLTRERMIGMVRSYLPAFEKIFTTVFDSVTGFFTSVRDKVRKFLKKPKEKTPGVSNDDQPGTFSVDSTALLASIRQNKTGVTPPDKPDAGNAVGNVQANLQAFAENTASSTKKSVCKIWDSAEHFIADARGQIGAIDIEAVKTDAGNKVEEVKANLQGFAGNAASSTKGMVCKIWDSAEHFIADTQGQVSSIDIDAAKLDAGKQVDAVTANLQEFAGNAASSTKGMVCKIWDSAEHFIADTQGQVSSIDIKAVKTDAGNKVKSVKAGAKALGSSISGLLGSKSLDMDAIQDELANVANAVSVSMKQDLGLSGDSSKIGDIAKEKVGALLSNLDRDIKDNVESLLARASDGTEAVRGFLERKAIQIQKYGLDDKTNDQQKGNYEAYARAVAKSSGVEMQDHQIPGLRVDDAKMNALGTQATYDAKKNEITISSEVANLLKRSSEMLTLSKQEMAVLFHEMRHAMQVEFGDRKIGEIAKGKQSFNVAMETSADPKILDHAEKSKKSFKDQAAKKGYTPTKAELDTVQSLEVDAYAFEARAEEILEKVAVDFRNQHKAHAKELLENGVGRFADQAEEMLPGIGAQAGAVATGFEAVSGSLAGLGIGAVAFDLLAKGLKFLSEGSLEAAYELSRVEKVLRFVTGSSDAAGRSLKYVRETSNKTGISAKESLSSYVGIKSATKDTELERSSDKIFEALSSASSAYALDSEAQQRVGVAFNQMISKGTISSEEIKGQLAESLPGSMAIAARSMGMTGQQFNRELGAGNVSSEEFMPKFADQILAETSSAVSMGSNSPDRIIARFNNQLQVMREEGGQDTLVVFKMGAAALIKVLEALNPLLVGVAISLATIGTFSGLKLAGVVGGGFLDSLGKVNNMVWLKELVKESDIFNKLTTGAGRLSLVTGGFGKIFSGISAGLKAIGPELLLFGKIMLVGQLLVDTFLGMGKVFEDAGSEAKAYGKQAEDYMNKMKGLREEQRRPIEGGILGAAGVNHGSGTKIDGDTIGNIARTNGQQDSYLSEHLIGKVLDSIVGKGAATTTEQTLQNAVLGPIASLFGIQGRTMHQKRYEDRFIATDEAMTTQNALRDNAKTYLKGGANSSKLDRVVEIDDELEKIQIKRKSLTSGQTVEKRELDAKASNLQDERSKATKEVSTIQAGMAQSLEARKALAKTIEADMKNPGTSPEEAEALKLQLGNIKAEIESDTRVMEQFSKAIGHSGDEAKKLKESFENIKFEVDFAKYKNELADLKSQTDNTKSKASLNEGQRQKLDSDQQKTQLTTKKQTAEGAIDQYRDQIRSKSAQKTLGGLGFGGIEAEDLDVGKLKKIRIEEGRSKNELEALIAAIEEMNGLRTEVASSEAELAGVDLAAADKIQDNTKAIADYYQQIVRTAEDTKKEVEQSMRDVKSTNESTRLKKALRSQQETFVNDYMKSYEELMKSFDNIGKAEIDHLSRLKGIVRSREDANKATEELAKQIGAGGTTDATMPEVGGESSGGSSGITGVANNTIRVTRTGKKDQYGGEVLEAQLVQDGKIVDRVQAASGVPSNQKFEKIGSNKQGAGSFAPIPEGSYNLGSVEKGDFGSAMGKTWVSILDSKTDSATIGGTGRGAFGLHNDENRLAGAPGSAGCVVFYDQAATNKVAGWVKSGARKMQVDWGLGSFSSQESKAPQGAAPRNAIEPTRRGGVGSSSDFVAPKGLTDEGQRMARYLKNPNVRAALDAIASAEGTLNKGETGQIDKSQDGYKVGYSYRGGVTYKAHPFSGSELTPGGSSTASGRYQFMGHTWKEMSQALGLKDFSPQSQNIAAIKLLERRGALGAIAKGNFGESVLNKLAPEWASIESGKGSGRGYYEGQLTSKGLQSNITKTFGERLAYQSQGGSQQQPSRQSQQRPANTIANSPAPQSPATPERTVIIPYDHIRGRIPDKTGGNTFAGSGQTGASYKGRTERDYQDLMIPDFAKQLQKAGYKVVTMKPEDFKSYEEYGNTIQKYSKKANTTVIPYHFDAEGGNALTRVRAGDAGDAKLGNALLAQMRTTVKSSSIRGQDTEGNATIKDAADAPAALVEVGAMSNMVDKYGTVQKFMQQEGYGFNKGLVKGLNNFYGGAPQSGRSSGPMPIYASSQGTGAQAPAGSSGGQYTSASGPDFSRVLNAGQALTDNNYNLQEDASARTRDADIATAQEENKRIQLQSQEKVRKFLLALNAEATRDKDEYESALNALGPDTLEKDKKNQLISAAREYRDKDLKLGEELITLQLTKDTAQNVVNFESPAHERTLKDPNATALDKEKATAGLQEINRLRDTVIPATNIAIKAKIAAIEKGKGLIKLQLKDIEEKSKIKLDDRKFSREKDTNDVSIGSAQAELAKLQANINAPNRLPSEVKSDKARIAALTFYIAKNAADQEKKAAEKKLVDDVRLDSTIDVKEQTLRKAKTDETYGRKIDAATILRDTEYKTLESDEIKLKIEIDGTNSESTIKGINEELKTFEEQKKAMSLDPGSNPMEGVDLSQKIADLKYQSESLAIVNGLPKILDDIAERGRVNKDTPENVERLKKAAIDLSKVQLTNLAQGFKNTTAEIARSRKELALYAREQKNVGDKEFTQLKATELRAQGQGAEALKIEYVVNLEEIKISVESKLKSIELDDKMDPALKARRRKQTTEGGVMQENELKYQSDKKERDRDFNEREIRFNSAIGVKSERGNLASAYGLDSTARQINGEVQLEQQALSKAKALKDLADQARELGFAPAVVAELTANIEKLDKLRVDNIKANMSPLVDAFKGMKSAATTALGSIISGAESVEDAFDKMIGSILEQLSNLAAQLIMDQLFSMLLPGLGKGGGIGGGGGGGGGIGGGIGKLFGFAEGGVVDSVGNSGQGLRDRPDAIGSALRKEGPNSVLATLTPGEMVLTVSQTRRYLGMGLHDQVSGNTPGNTMANVSRSERFGQVLGFASGGIVPGGGGPIVVRGGQSIGSTNINIPIAINGDSGDKPSVNIPRLHDAVRSTVLEEMRRQRRPGASF